MEGIVADGEGDGVVWGEIAELRGRNAPGMLLRTYKSFSCLVEKFTLGEEEFSTRVILLPGDTARCLGTFVIVKTGRSYWH